MVRGRDDLDGAGAFALYPLRLALAAIFIVAGWGKLTAFTPWSDTIASLGFPLPDVTAGLVVIGELFGGIGILLGVLTRFSAATHTVIIFTALLTRIFGDPAGWMLDVAVLGGSLALVINGPGRPTITSVLDLDVDDPELLLWERLPMVGSADQTPAAGA